MRTATGLLSLAGVALLAASSHAGVIAQIEIIAENDQGTATWTRTVQPSLDGSFSWTSPTGGPLADGVLSNGVQIFGAGLGWIHDPVVTSSFNMSAGLSNTTITVNSAILSFDPIVNGAAVANASITVTDSATFGTAGQLWIQGLQGNNSAFAARVRSGNLADPLNLPTDLFALVPGSSSQIFTGSTHTFTGASASFPAFDLVPGTVTEIRSQFRFTLSAGDRAAGTSYFEIIPAPGSAGVLALGGLMAARRRRR